MGIDKILKLTYEIEGLLLLFQNRGIDALPTSVKDLLGEKTAQLSEMISASSFAKNETEESFATDEEKLIETVEFEQEEDSEPEAGMPDAYQTKIDEAQAEEDEADSEAAEMQEADNLHSAQINSHIADGAALLKMFTLNDRYRFANELFGGSTTALTAILEDISRFSTLSQVKEYLYFSQGVSQENPAAKEFIEKLSPNFD